MAKARGKNVRTVLITGCSSGIGKAATKLFAEKGWNVIATMRKPETETARVSLPASRPVSSLAPPENVFVTRLDVEDGDSIARAIESGIAHFGRIDALVNNAGFGLAGIFESIPREKIQEQFAVNVIGLMDVTRALLPHLRKNKSGLIINISSRAGLVGLPLNTLYCAGKFAVEGFTEALSYELASQSIIVKLIEPAGGVSSTEFGKRVNAERAQTVSPADYDGFIARTSAAYAELAAKRMATADEIAQVIYNAATDGTHRLRYFCGEDTGGLVQAKRELSDLDFTDFMRSRFPG